jgi:tRNA(His) guanylyltransferase
VKFDDLDAKMRVFETNGDHCVLPGVHIVARLDGRGFTKLTKERERFEAPFDERFRDHMAATVEHLMNCGFRVVFGYTQSDEMSLLFHPEDGSFGRKTRKINSVLAGEASAAFSLRLGSIGCFDCRVCELPRQQDVRDYFRWRQEDAGRNALGAHCYWLLRKRGMGQGEATSRLLGLSTSENNELLFAAGINFDELPAWQKRGTGFYFETYERVGTNPVTGESHAAQRRRLRREAELPRGADYDALIATFLDDGSSTGGMPAGHTGAPSGGV